MAGNRALDDKLKAGIEAARRGDRANAQKLLRQVVDQNPNNETAWMWLASVSDNLSERRMCLERALRLNPRNTRAQEALRQLGVATPRTGGAPARPAARPGNQQSTGSRYLIVGGAAVLVLVMIFVVGNALAPQVETPNAATLAVFETLVSTAPPTATIDPDTFTATPFYGVVVDQPTLVRTLPPTFTPTFTITPSPLPPPTATLFPASAFTLLTISQPEGATQTGLYQSSGDGSNSEPLGARDAVFSDVAIAPNGETVAFVQKVTYTNSDNVEVTAPELFVGSLNNLEAARQITQLGGTKLESPTWAPDSIQMVFVSDVGGDDNLWYITEDGQNLRPMTTNTGVDKDPAWSPDGEVILYASDQAGLPGSGVTQIFSVTPDGLTINQVTQSGNSSYSPAWSPDGSKVAFASDRNSDGDIFVMDPDGQSVFLLTVDGQGPEDRQPAFTPDGRWVVFLSNRDGDTFQLYRSDLEAKILEQVSNVNYNIESFTFRPLVSVGTG